MKQSIYERKNTKKNYDSHSHSLHKISKRLAVLLFGLLPFICCMILSFKEISLIADSKRGYAYVNTEETSLAVRLSAGTDGLLLDRLPKNSQVLVTGANIDSKGDTWYEIKYVRGSQQFRTGYVHSDYLKFFNDIAPTGEDPEFEIFMESQNFPESYKVYLRILHKQHPTWIFNAQHIDMDWEYALKEESKVGVNMIQTHFPYSWRSMEEGAYNWNSQSWNYLDSNCYGASSTIVAHFLDPRNGLYNDSVIFQFEDLSYLPELHTAQDTYNILKGTFLAGEYSFEALQNDLYPSYGLPIPEETPTNGKQETLPKNGNEIKNESETETDTDSNIETNETTTESASVPNTPVKYTYKYVDTLMEAAKYANVSPFFLASRIRQEVGSGSTLAYGTQPGYEGYYNFFNIGAYAHSGRSARENGAIYAKNNDTEGSYLRPWSNPYRSILGGADFLSSGYIQREQNTLYLQKFDVTNGSNGFFYHQYMSNVNAPSAEATSMKRAYTNSGIYENRAFSFQIPVYKNMPELAACQPYSDDSYATNNNWLSSITVEGGQFTKSFARTTYEYTVKVSDKVSKVNISANACANGAKILGTGEVTLAGDTTKHVITVLAPSFEIRTYTLNVVKSSEIATPTATATATSAPTNTAAPTASSAPTATVTATPTATPTAIPTTSATATASATATPTATATPSQTPTAAPTPTLPDPTIKSTDYIIGEFITGIEPQTSVGDFLSKFKVTNGSLQILDSKGNSKASGNIVTGDVLQLYKESELYEDYQIIIYGDVNADGKVSLMDMIAIQRHLVKLSNLEEIYLTASDANHDDKCSLMDMISIQRHIIKLDNIKQTR